MIGLAPLPVLWVLALVAAPAAQPPKAAQETCRPCHSKLGGRKAKPALDFPGDVHDQPGLGCAGCHGGDPTATVRYLAMNREKGFRKLKEPAEALEVCGGCHADVAFMKRYAPNLSTDQRAKLLASRHASQYALGDREAPVCTSCHGAHGIFSPRDPRSTVHPNRVAELCARCHAHPEKPGAVELYAGSVHQAALAKGNLSSAGCPSCHGSHGAYTPRAESVGTTCGKCHPLNLELFRASAHRGPLEGKDPGACGPCHASHATTRSSDAQVSVAAGGICGSCHNRVDDWARQSARGMAAAIAATTLNIRGAEGEVAKVRARGMIMVDADAALQEARQEFVQARGLIHGVNLSAIEERTAAADAAARRALDAASSASSELTYRRRGLWGVLSIILVAIAGLVTQIRRSEGRR